MFSFLSKMSLQTLWNIRGGLLKDLVTAATDFDRYRVSQVIFIVDYLIFSKWAEV